MNPHPIVKVIIKRFRSFPSAILEMGNPVFVVGRNGSGKSNLADVFSFVAEAMASPLQAVFDRKGGIAAVRNRSSVKSAPPNMGLAFEIGSFNGIDGGRFAFEIKALPNYGFRIVREQCLVRMKRGRGGLSRIRDMVFGRARIVAWPVPNRLGRRIPGRSGGAARCQGCFGVVHAARIVIFADDSCSRS